MPGFPATRVAQVRPTTVLGADVPASSASGFSADAKPTAQSKSDVLAFIAGFQQEHAGDASDAMFATLGQALQNRYGIPRWDVGGGTLSNNEFDIFGEKVKVRGGEGGSNPFWFPYGSSDGGGATAATGSAPAGSASAMVQAAQAAAKAMRAKAGKLGRSSTILGGFAHTGAPTVASTALGGY